MSVTTQSHPTNAGSAGSEEAGSDIRSALLRGNPANPALQRLRGRVLANAEANEVITSYTRMHHRHNRS